MKSNVPEVYLAEHQILHNMLSVKEKNKNKIDFFFPIDQ